MSTAQHCRAMAAEAERLAGIVSYGRDKSRLEEQARSWTAKALALEAVPAAARGAPAKRGLFTRLKERLIRSS